jgi:hypothetical protein
MSLGQPDILAVDVDLRFESLEKKLDTAISKIDSIASKHGLKAGRTFGNQMAQSMKGAITGALPGILSLIAGANIIGGIASGFSKAINLATENRKAKAGLTALFDSSIGPNGPRGAVFQKRNNLADTFAKPITSDEDIAQRARSLGIKNDLIYEEVSATGAASEAAKVFKQQKNDLENAYKKEEFAINGKITALENETKAQINALRAQKGYTAFTDKQAQLTLDIQDETITLKEAELNNDQEQIVASTNLIKRKNIELDIIDTKIQKIDIETSKIENQNKVILDGYKDQLSIQKDILANQVAPLQEKIDNLSTTAGGTSKRINPAIEKQVREYKPAAKITTSEEASQYGKQYENLADKLFQGELFKGANAKLLKKSTINRAIRDMIQFNGNMTITELESTFKGFFNVIAAGKSEAVSFDSAFGQLAEQFRSGRAQLGETAGLTEEYLSDLDNRGISVLQNTSEEIAKMTGLTLEQVNAMDLQSVQGKTSTDQLDQNGKGLVRYAGFLVAAKERGDTFTNQVKDGAYVMTSFDTQIENIQAQLGEVLLPILIGGGSYGKGLITHLSEFLGIISDWINQPENQKKIKDLSKSFLDLVQGLIDWFNNKENIENLKRFWEQGVQGAKDFMIEADKIKAFFTGDWVKAGDGGFLGTDIITGKVLGFSIGKNFKNDQHGASSDWKAAGGLISGKNVPYILNDGAGPEYVMKHEALKKYGVGYFDNLNNLSTPSNDYSSNNSNNTTYNNYGMGTTKSPGFKQLSYG